MSFKILRHLSAWFVPVAAVFGHDTWVETNVAIVRIGEPVYVDFMLGNHGNDHRDFKLAGKPHLEGSKIEVIGPDGSRTDLKPSFVDRGYAPNEGYWTARFEPIKPGLYEVIQTSDPSAGHSAMPVVRGAKTFFVASASLEQVAPDLPGFDRVSGAGLELVPELNPVAPMASGLPIKVRLLFKGKPLVGEKVSFIPRGETLAGAFDPHYERRTDANGSVSLETKESNTFLVVAHHVEAADQGTGAPSTEYSATLTVIVPEQCPFCGE